MEVNKIICGDCLEVMNSFDVIFCPNCGAVNRINLNWYGSIQGLIFCWKCGEEL